jgi:hypothetical protein
MFVGLALAGAVCGVAVGAEDGIKTLPTLLIKGEVVSVDASDPSANLLTVKDRYGFETPILLTPETKIAQGTAEVNAGQLSAGTAVEVEYNFDVNTAKRHAVSVKLPSSAAAEPPAPLVVTPDAVVETSEMQAPSMEMEAPESGTVEEVAPPAAE